MYVIKKWKKYFKTCRRVDWIRVCDWVGFLKVTLEPLTRYIVVLADIEVGEEFYEEVGE